MAPAPVVAPAPTKGGQATVTVDSTIDMPTFRKFARLVYDRAGIKLGPHKRALVCARVAKRMRQLGIRKHRDYFRAIEEDASGSEAVELLNAISTNVTQFFREARHFGLLDRLLKGWEANGQTRFRIWCAACSTGEEPYSVAIAASEALESIYDTKILATDISTKALARAREGAYEPRHVEHVPNRMLLKYFERRNGSEPVHYLASEELRRMITFGRINLSKPPFPLKGPLDVIFCRNVMIYFDNEVRRRLLADMYRLLKRGGYLMVGHAESLSGMLSDFKSVEPSVYVKR